MSLEQFLNDIEVRENAREKEKQLRLAEEERQKKIVKEKEFQKSFSSFYSEKVCKDFENVLKKLNKKFLVSWPTDISIPNVGILVGHVIIAPKFDSYIKYMTVTIIGESSKQLVVINGLAFDIRRKQLGGNLTPFSGPWEKFIKINIENVIEKLLYKYFIESSNNRKNYSRDNKKTGFHQSSR